MDGDQLANELVCSSEDCDAALLAKLEEQNRKLENDSKGLTRVPNRQMGTVKKEDSKVRSISTCFGRLYSLSCVFSQRVD
jgi:hypothetical protein